MGLSGAVLDETSHYPSSVMKSYLELSSRQQRDILQEAQAGLGIDALFLEKDFWVCVVLNILFREPSLKSCLCFRGGTSLSKVHGCIQRFSEDIDIALPPSFFPDMPDVLFPDAEDSTAQRDRKQRRMREYYRNMMRDLMLPLFEREFRQAGIRSVSLELEDLDRARDPFVLLIRYPSVLQSQVNPYVKQQVKLELSGRAQTEPSSPARIDSYLAHVFPELSRPVELLAVSPERTFWEKAFLLHEENVRGAPVRPRQARHYYDLDSLARHGMFDAGLFEPIKRQRALNYGYSWVDYESLEPFGMKVLPDDDIRYQAWAKDYELMKPMLFGEVEEFETIMQRLRHFIKLHFR